jgi:uncharacterized membrane protein
MLAIRTLATEESFVICLRGMMRFILPCFLLLALVTLALAKQQTKLIRIRNIGKEPYKVCTFDAGDRTLIIPKRCWELRASETATWNQSANTSFNLQVSQPWLLDISKCHKYDIRADVAQIDIEPKGKYCEIHVATPTVLRFCNETGAKLHASYAYWLDSGGWVSRGWYTIESRKCADVPVAINYEGDIYYFATDDDDGRWGGDVSFCVNWNENFALPKSDESSCQGKGYARVGMTKLTVKPGITTQRLTP